MSTEDLKKRNDDLCKTYQSGASINDCCELYGLKGYRVRQILKAGGVWQPRKKSPRTEYLGVHLRPETKEQLKELAKKAQVSASNMAACYIDEAVTKATHADN